VGLKMNIQIELTEREVNLILSCIDTNIETIKRRADVSRGEVIDLLQELAEIDIDIREQAFRDDGWGDAETQMFTAGVDAREKIKAKASSHAQERRHERTQESRDARAADRRQEFLDASRAPFDSVTEHKQTSTQLHNLWEKPDNDPVDW
jgi:hypothetical protein